MYISTNSLPRRSPNAWLARTIRPEPEVKGRSIARRPRPPSRSLPRPLQHAMPLAPRPQPIELDKLRARLAKVAATEQKSRAVQVATLENARQAAATMIVAGLVLLVFNSEALTGYVRDLPPNLFTDGLVVLADGWHGLLGRIGVADLFSPVREGVEWLRELRF